MLILYPLFHEIFLSILFAMIENFSIFDSEISVLLFYAKAGDLKKSTRF